MSQIEITFVQPDGSEQTVAVDAGVTLMEAALFNGIDGIQGLCGGVCSCATCHVALEPELVEKLQPASGGEAEMIRELDDHEANSRLGCQVPVTDALAGARIRIKGTFA